MGTNVNNALIMVYRAYYFQYYEICRKGLHYIQYLLLCEINLFSAVYFCNGAQRYEQFLQIGWLYRALILIGLALSSEHLCVFSLCGAIYIFF